MDFGKILGRAWEITRRWKVLWVLGFLVSLGSGGGASNYYSFGGRDRDFSGHGVDIAPEWVAVIIAIACLGVLLGIALWVITVMARGGLIAGVQQVEDNRTTAFRQAWRVGRRRFWTLFGLDVLASLPVLALLLTGIAGVVGIIATSHGAFAFSDWAGSLGVVGAALCGGTLCCGAILASVLLNQIRVYAERAAILEQLRWLEAFKRGWQVLKENLGPTLILWLIFLVIGLVFAAVILGGLGILAIPFMVLFRGVDASPWLIAPICAGGALGWIVYAAISSVVQTFTSASWTLAYRQLTGYATLAAPLPTIEPDE